MNNLLKLDAIMSWPNDFHRLSKLHSLTKHILIFFAENFFGWLVSGGFIWTCRTIGTRGTEGQLLPFSQIFLNYKQNLFCQKIFKYPLPTQILRSSAVFNWNRVKAGLRASIIKRWFEVFLNSYEDLYRVGKTYFIVFFLNPLINSNTVGNLCRYFIKVRKDFRQINLSLIILYILSKIIIKSVSGKTIEIL